MKKFGDYFSRPKQEEKKLSIAEEVYFESKKRIAEENEKRKELQERLYVDKIVDKNVIRKEFVGKDLFEEEKIEEPTPELQPLVEQVFIPGEPGRDGVKGEKGDKGDKGDRGERGPQGDRGNDGRNGRDGTKGDKGDQGEKGDKGDRGDDGRNGVDGKDGAKGDKGDRGEKGDQGDKGDAGRDGNDGRDGKDGINGTNGEKGDRGDKGDKGDKGEPGRDGKDGAKGDKGDRGEKGDKGDKGDSGKDGQTPDIKPLFDKFNKLSLDINTKVGRIVGDMGALAGGGGSGSYWLNDLGDTDYSSIVNATDGQVLTYNSTTGKWTAADATGGGGSVGTLQQVTTAGNTTTRGITVASVQLNLSSAVTVTQGQMAWNPQDLTVDVGMANGVTLQLGQEQYIKVKASAAISDGQAVMFTGADGEHILAAPNDMSVTGYRPEYFIGVATQDLAHNGFGYVTTFGKVHGLNTLAFVEGDILYADPAVVGGLTKTEPQAPHYNIMVAAVTKRAGGDGHIMVRPTWRPSLSQLNDVGITSVANNNLLKYIAANSRWENVTLSSVIEPAYAKANSANVLAQAAFDQANTIPSQLINGADTLSLDGLSKINLPGGTSYIFSATNNITLAPDNTGNNYLEIINNTGATISTDRAFEIRTNADGTDKVWTFSQGGAFFFPDASYQTTAFTGTAIDQTARNSANAATTIAQSAYNYANTIVSDTQIDPFARTQANAAFDKANTAITTSGGQTISGNLTSNSATAFIAGTAANSGVALQMPFEGALRNMTNGDNTMYFDVSNGGTTNGRFRFRSSSNFTELLDISTDGLRAISAYKGKTPYNSAIDTVVTVDNIKYRVSNQGGIFPQIASASGNATDVCYDVEGVVNGAGVTSAQNSGYILLADGTWLSIYSSHGMDARGDRLTAHVTDKAAGKIYRATFMRTNNSSNVDGYNIIVERIL